MFKFTANFIDEDKEISLPESWEDVTYTQYIDLVNRDDKKWITRLSILTGLEVDIIGQLPTHVVDMFINIISFMADQSDLEKANVIPKEYEAFNYSSVEYAHHCRIMDEIKKYNEQGLNILNAAPVIVEYCTGKRKDSEKFDLGLDIRQRPVTEVVGLANFFLSHLTGF